MPGAAGGGKDDKPGIDFAGVNEGSKVSGILGDEGEVVLDATGQDSMVGSAEAAKVPGANQGSMAGATRGASMPRSGWDPGHRGD